MSELLRTKLINKALDLGLYLGNQAATMINDDWENIERDYDSSLKMIQSNGETDPEEYLSTILDAHMDTLVQSVVNILVSAVTECALDENGTPVDIPDLGKYALANREHYNLT